MATFGDVSIEFVDHSVMEVYDSFESMVSAETEAADDDEDEEDDDGEPKKRKKKGVTDYSKMSLQDVVGTIHGKLPHAIGQASRSKGALLRRFSSGIFVIDCAIGGGWPWGRFIRIIGPSSKGKSSLLLKSIASAQRYCRYCRFEFLPDPVTAEDKCFCVPKCTDCGQDYTKRVLTDVEREAMRVRAVRGLPDGTTEPDLEGEILFDFFSFFDDFVCGCMAGDDKPRITQRSGYVRTAFCDIENTFTQAWAQDLGVNTDLVILVVPEYAEQAIDIVTIFVQSNQIDIVGIDSLAAMTPTVEVEESAERDQMGVAARKINKAFRTWAAAINKMGLTTQNKPSVFIINQVREKIASRFNPQGGETEPGGRAQVFHSSIDVRVNASYHQDDKGNAIYAKTKFFVKKNKTFQAQERGIYKFYFKAKKGHPVGDTDEYNVVLDYSLDYNVIQKKQNIYFFEKRRFNTQAKIVSAFFDDPFFFKQVRERTLELVIGKTMEKRAVKTIEGGVSLPATEEPDGSQKVGGKVGKKARKDSSGEGGAEAGATDGAGDGPGVQPPPSNTPARKW